MTYVELLQEWADDQKANHGLVGVRFFPNHFPSFDGNPPMKLFEGPDPTVEQLAEAAYRLLTDDSLSKAVDVSELDL